MGHKVTDHYIRIKHFMKLAGQDVPEFPIEPSKEVRELRAKLILEEAFETVRALGFEMKVGPIDIDEAVGKVFDCYYTLEESFNFDLVEVIDGCCDVSVVTRGTLIACGVPDQPFLEEVDENNIQKIENGTIREDGKLVKHPDHKPPQIEAILQTCYPKAKPAERDFEKERAVLENLGKPTSYRSSCETPNESNVSKSEKEPWDGQSFRWWEKDWHNPDWPFHTDKWATSDGQLWSHPDPAHQHQLKLDQTLHVGKPAERSTSGFKDSQIQPDTKARMDDVLRKAGGSPAGSTDKENELE